MLKKTNFESLANELIHDVFDYLTPYEILRCFRQLNRRFSHLISQHLFQLDLSHLSRNDLDLIQRNVPLEQIITLKFSGKYTVNICSRILFSSMNHLRTLIVSNVNYRELRNLFESKHFSSLEQLTTLKIQSSAINSLDCERLVVLKKIFSQMNHLRICQIPLIDMNDFDELSIPSATLEELTIDYCTMAALDRLFAFIPSVQHLNVKIYTDLQNFSNDLSIIERKSLNLRSFSISTTNNIPFAHIEHLCRHEFKSLENLTFLFKTDAASQSCLDYIDDKRWEILLRSFGSLRQFHCAIELPIKSETIIETCVKQFRDNDFFIQRNWRFSLYTYTYAFNTVACLHTDPYPRRRFDLTPSKVFSDDHQRNIYSAVRDLRLLIDNIGKVALHPSSKIAYENVTSLTLITNKSFPEQTLFRYISSILHLQRLRYLTIQVDNCTNDFLPKFLDNSPRLYSLNISTYQSWTKLIQIASIFAKHSIRSLTVHEALLDLNAYEQLLQLFHRLEMLHVSVRNSDDCYRLLTILFIGDRNHRVKSLRTLTIKCDFDDPDAMAHWIQTNIQRKLSYKCTMSMLTMWL